jgi:hypothetical protein
MTRRHDHSQLLAREEVVSPPPLLNPACDDHTFELPTRLYIAMAGLFLGFVTVLTLGFSSHMAVSYGVIAAFMVAFFAVPTIFVLTGPAEQRRTRSLRWQDFLDHGVVTGSGRISGREAMVLVLLLPFLIFCFGLIVAMSAALIS